MRDPVIVLKFGGSVLREESDLALGVREIERWVREGYKVVAVVSAFEGTTDALLARGRARCQDGRGETVAMLLATGELTTASLLALAAEREGLPARVLGPHALGLRTTGNAGDADPAAIDLTSLERALAASGVVVVPGFVGVGEDSAFTLLGRGGSDLTALFIAASLGNARCRLIKDVDGLYERDPALPGPPPRKYEELGWTDGLALDGGIVQHKALRLAREHRLEFEVGAFAREDVTRVGPGPARFVTEAKEVIHAL